MGIRVGWIKFANVWRNFRAGNLISFCDFSHFQVSCFCSTNAGRHKYFCQEIVARGFQTISTGPTSKNGRVLSLCESDIKTTFVKGQQSDVYLFHKAKLPRQHSLDNLAQEFQEIFWIPQIKNSSKKFACTCAHINTSNLYLVSLTLTGLVLSSLVYSNAVCFQGSSRFPAWRNQSGLW